MNCPKCGGPLKRVKQGPYSMLNSEQFDAIKAGDYFCEQCPGNGRGASSGLCYWWEHEVTEACRLAEQADRGEGK